MTSLSICIQGLQDIPPYSSCKKEVGPPLYTTAGILVKFTQFGVQKSLPVPNAVNMAGKHQQNALLYCRTLTDFNIHL
jgi:hypothetical protein